MIYIDTHTHLFSPQFDTDRPQVIQAAIDQNITAMVLPNINVDTIEAMWQTYLLFPQHCYPTIGLHPCDVKQEFKLQLDQMEKYLSDQRIVAIGETGLDYYWDTTHKAQQKEALEIQCDWALDTKLPIILHTRESTEDTIEIIRRKQNGELTGVFHCFSGTEDQAKAIIDLGFYLGVGGTITFKKNDLRNFITHLSLTSIVLETDAPYLAPTPHRGQRNQSSYIPLVAQELAYLYQVSIEVMAAQTTQNALSLFTKIKL